MPSSSYKLIAKKGQGGMAEVFKAVKTGPDGFEKIVALKKIIPHQSDQHQFIRMLSAEAKINSYLSHPNIVQILDFFEEHGQYSMALEYVDGLNVKELIQIFKDKGQQLPWQACIFIATETLKALNYAHNKDGPNGPLHIIHRDISPHNILISYQGEVKLSDFGIAKAKITREETASGVLKGKYRYLSPEQIMDGALEPSTDLFSLGVTLYEMLSMSYPFGEQQEYQTFQKILDQPHEPLKKLLPNLKPEISSVVDQALQKNPKDRFTNAKEFYEHLLGLQDASWITHGQELLATLLTHNVPATVRIDTPIEKTSKLAKPIENQNSLLASSPTMIPLRPDTKFNLIFHVGFLFVALIIGGATYELSQYMKHKKARHQAEEPIPQTVISTPPETTQDKEEIKVITPQKIMKNFGKLTVHGPEGTHVYVNGKDMGDLPLKPLTLPAGKYIILLDGEDDGQQMKKITVNAKEPVTISWK